jgi:transcriptional regulator with XRE-family HTH domain
MEPHFLPAGPLRERRRAAGLTQAELASRAGVSRQLIAAVEAGQNAPSVDAALRLADALATTVEALFAPVASPHVLPALEERLHENRPLRVGRVGDQLVAAELPDHGAAGASWARPDGRIEAGQLLLFDNAAPAGFVLAGCDPALGIAEAMLSGRGERSLLALPAPTGLALRALHAGRIHAAVVHGPEQELGEPPLPVHRLHLARWQVGIAYPSELRFTDLGDLADSGLAVVQRGPAASNQQALERALRRVGHDRPPAGPQATGHIEAARTAAILNCAALTTESAARAFALRFLPLEEHAVQIWVAEVWTAQPAFAAFADVLSSAAFTGRVGQFGGYELAGCGSRV